MKQWKTIAIVIGVMLWIALLIYVVKRPKGESVAPAQRAPVQQVPVQLTLEQQAQQRKAELQTVVEVERLITEILQLRFDAAVLRSKMQPPTPQPAQQQTQNVPSGAITGMEFVPMDKIPPDAKVSDGLGAPMK